MLKNFLRKCYISLFLAALVTLIVFVFTSNFRTSNLFDSFEAKLLEWRYLKRIDWLKAERINREIENIVIIDIDDRSMNKLGRFAQWPRTYHARIIDYLTKAGAAAIGFDILFLEHDKNSDHDNEIFRASDQSGKVYHAISFSSADTLAFIYAKENSPPEFNIEKYSIQLPGEITTNLRLFELFDGNLVELYNTAAGVGFVNFLADEDGVLRSMPMLLSFAGRQYPAFSLAIALGYMKKKPADLQVVPGIAITLKNPEPKFANFYIPIDENATMLINYQGPFQSFRYISYCDVLEEQIPPEFFNNKIVLIGTSAPGNFDIKPVPFKSVLPGVEVHANVLYNILTQKFIRCYSTKNAYVFVFLLAAIVGFFAMFLRTWQSILMLVVIGSTFFVITFYLFTRDAIWIQQFRPILGLLFGFTANYIYRYVHEERDKRRIKVLFQRYVSSEVVNEMLKRGEMPKLGGERREATAFFSDIKSFTTLSENLRPEDLIKHLNEYLSAMTEVVLKYQGFLDKYEGDAIMAIFGVPLFQDDHAERACWAALEMQEKMIKLRKKWQAEGKPEFYIRIGINSGYMIAGNIGGERRMDYTVIGDSVNLASRLEGANKQYGTDIIISEFTNALLQINLLVPELEKIRKKGKIDPAKLTQLIHNYLPSVSVDAPEINGEIEKWLTWHRNRAWDQLLQALERAGEEKPDSPSPTGIVSAFARELLKKRFVVRELDKIRVMGKFMPVRVFELAGKSVDLLPVDRKEVLEKFEKGLMLYRSRQWDDAIEVFKSAIDIQFDPPSATYLKRCELFKGIPVPAKWDGVFEMETK